MRIEDFSQKLYEKYGPVTRARGPFLYTKKGVRITDLYQEDGRAILGWDGKNAFTYLKNVLSRGQTGSFICEDKSRVEKAISTLLSSERRVVYFSNKIDAIKAAMEISPHNISVYRPWCLEDEMWAKIDAVVIEPSLPWTQTLYLLAVRPDVTGLPHGAIQVPYALQAAVARATYNLVEAIKSRQEKDWFIYDTVLTKYFERRGPYLTPKVPEEKYDEFVLHCLNLGIAINPEHKGSSLVPYGADKGVFTCLKNNPFEFFVDFCAK